MKATFVYLVMQLISIQGLHLNLERHTETEKMCLKLQCMENKTDDTEFSALVNMSVYWISESDDEVMLASISESDSKVLNYKITEAEVTGKMSKDYGELIVSSFNNSLSCTFANFACEINFINKSGNQMKRVYYTMSPESNDQKQAMLLMTLKAKTYDFVTTVDAMANFLKSFGNPNKHSADLAMSLQMLKSESGQHSEYDISLTTDGITEGDKRTDVASPLPLLNSKLNNKRGQGRVEGVASKNCTQKDVLDSLLEIRNSAQSMIAIGNSVENLLNKVLQNSLSQSDWRDTNATLSNVLPLTSSSDKTNEVDLEENSNFMFINKCVIKNDTNLPDRDVVKLDDHKETLCDTKTDGGGWIVIQRRFKGDVNFTRNWREYKEGFGTTLGDYWLGNDWISNLTHMGYNRLRVDMTFHGRNYSSEYVDFTLGNEAASYLIHFKTLRDSTNTFIRHSGYKFTTIDRDNDVYDGNCALRYKGGWWYDACHSVNINGVWGHLDYGMGLNWVGITGYYDTLSFVEMKIRKG
ncbi:angiopoietin-2-like [Physella acuta]|uniref:angiopoietin-2-like n=1 Tax=Physella acuta TaxID=109671 RepID=UPI0027DDC3B7|nr:angiopoietin-2-like [Physella acuta]